MKRLAAFLRAIADRLEPKADFPPTALDYREGDFPVLTDAVPRTVIVPTNFGNALFDAQLEQIHDAGNGVVASQPNPSDRKPNTSAFVPLPASPPIANCEFAKTPGIRRRKKLVSVPKE